MDRYNHLDQFKTSELSNFLNIIIRRLSFKLSLIDITTDGALLKEMRRLSNKERALPPQIFHSSEYLGVSFE